MAKLAYLDITSWVGISIGAEHFYGNLIMGDNKIELMREITIHEAVALDKKDGGWGTRVSAWKNGDKTTNRFNNRKSIAKVAIEIGKEKGIRSFKIDRRRAFIIIYW
jgi:hypothetical protein